MQHLFFFAFFAGLGFVGIDGQVDKNGLAIALDCWPYCK